MRQTGVVPLVAFFALAKTRQSEAVPPLETVDDAVDYIQSLGLTYLPSAPMHGQGRFIKSGVELTIAGWSQTQANKASSKPARIVRLFLTLELGDATAGGLVENEVA